jgi:hypothetical protein
VKTSILKIKETPEHGKYKTRTESSRWKTNALYKNAHILHLC